MRESETIMKLKAFSVRDSKAEVYGQPFYGNTHGHAERSFSQLVNDKTSQPGQYPEDFDLYHIGEYDDQTGIFTPLDTPNHVQKAVNCIRPVQ